MEKISKHNQQGLTLIELLIAVAIVGIISAVAYPSYQGMLVSAARSTAQADLMAFASAMERHSASTFSYSGAAQAGADTGIPSIFAAHSPATEPQINRKYSLTISNVGANGQTYSLTATPITGGITDGSGVLVLYSDGRKGWDQNNNGTIDNNEFCWHC